MNSQERGANIQAPSLKPSVDLAKLVDLLAAAIASDKPASQAADPKSRSLFLFDASKNRLRICTSSVLLRLYSASDFKQAFLSKDSSGFIRDFTSPPFGLRAKLGGELLADNRLRLPGNVDKLMAAIGQALDGALPTPMRSQHSCSTSPRNDFNLSPKLLEPNLQTKLIRLISSR